MPKQSKIAGEDHSAVRGIGQVMNRMGDSAREQIYQSPAKFSSVTDTQARNFRVSAASEYDDRFDADGHMWNTIDENADNQLSRDELEPGVLDGSIGLSREMLIERLKLENDLFITLFKLINFFLYFLCFL